VIERDHEFGNPDIESYPLMIAKGFTKAVTAVVPFQIYVLTPRFDKPIHRRNSQASPLSKEKGIIILIVSAPEVPVLKL
jgi:hypothetical protein